MGSVIQRSGTPQSVVMCTKRSAFEARDDADATTLLAAAICSLPDGGQDEEGLR